MRYRKHSDTVLDMTTTNTDIAEHPLLTEDPVQATELARIAFSIRDFFGEYTTDEGIVTFDPEAETITLTARQAVILRNQAVRGVRA